MKAPNASSSPLPAKANHSRSKAEELIGKTPNLRAPSATVVKLLNLLKDPNADYDEVISCVRRDLVLTTKLLALCNSASYGLSKPIASLNQVVQYLGYCDTLRMVMELSFGGQIGVKLPGYSMEAGTLWNHSRVAAQLAPHVLGLSKIVPTDASIAYTGGLVHDIGKVVLGQNLAPASHAELRRIVKTEGVSWLDAESTVLGCNHAEIGACLLRQWNIPEVIVEGVANHHNPPLEHGPKLSAVLHVVDASTHSVGASPGELSVSIVVRNDVQVALRLTEEHLETLTLAAFEAAQQIDEQKHPETVRMPDDFEESLSF